MPRLRPSSPQLQYSTTGLDGVKDAITDSLGSPMQSQIPKGSNDALTDSEGVKDAITDSEGVTDAITDSEGMQPSLGKSGGMWGRLFTSTWDRQGSLWALPRAPEGSLWSLLKKAQSWNEGRDMRLSLMTCPQGTASGGRCNHRFLQDSKTPCGGRAGLGRTKGAGQKGRRISFPSAECRVGRKGGGA